VGSIAFDQALAYLYDLQKYGIKFGLSSTSNLLRSLGNPHRRVKAIHIAGTNGKGSTAAMISAMLVAANYRVGLYTSPHLIRFNERFRIDEHEVGDDDILEVFGRVRRVVDDREPPTFFEMTTAMALELFAEHELDWAVLEVGMGGRLDATNVVTPEITVITNVSLEHQEFLGSSLRSIAWEKTGIIKQGVPLVTAVEQPVALAVVKSRCLECKAPCYRVGRQIRVRSQGRRRFTYHGLRWQLRDVRLPLEGHHQLRNAATAIGTLEVLQNRRQCSVAPERIRAGLARTRWPGRLEWLSHRPRILLDGAHNYAGVLALCRTLPESFAYRRLIVVLGVMADKDIRGMLRRLAGVAAHIILTRPRYERRAEPEAVLKIAGVCAAPTEVINSVEAALARAGELAAQEDLVVVTGSLYFIGEVKEIHEHHRGAGDVG
jgi:dihydrofolate synthase/folylpolyglutamate synthase